jgi:allantoin racemase
MRKIAFLAGGSGKLSPELVRRNQILQSATTCGTQVDMYGGLGSMKTRNNEIKKTSVKMGSIESLYDEFISVPHYLAHAIEAEKEGYDAIILSCGSDPGLDAVREAVRIPVVGPGSSSMHVCSFIGHRFCRLATHRLGRKRLGLLPFEVTNGLQKWVSIRDIGLTVPQVRDNPEGAFNACLEQGRLAIEEEAVDVVTYSCMSMAFLDFDERLSEKLEIPVVNPVKAAVRMAELCIDFKLKHSKISYPIPNSLL